VNHDEPTQIARCQGDHAACHACAAQRRAALSLTGAGEAMFFPTATCGFEAYDDDDGIHTPNVQDFPEDIWTLNKKHADMSQKSEKYTNNWDNKLIIVRKLLSDKHGDFSSATDKRTTIN
jgi:hypothetical protein